MRIISKCRYSNTELNHYLESDPNFRNHLKSKLAERFAYELLKTAKITEREIPGSRNVFDSLNSYDGFTEFEYDAFVIQGNTFKGLVEFLKSQGLRSDTIHGIMEFFEKPL
jgi:hypothetical protein